MINTKATTRNKLEPLLTVADTGIFNYESIAKEGSSDEVLAQLAQGIKTNVKNEYITNRFTALIFLPMSMKIT